MIAKHWLQSGLLALAATALPAAHAVNNMPQVMQDTVTNLKIDLGWDVGGSGYVKGQYWDVWFAETWDDLAKAWRVELSYLHKTGPHGEQIENVIHALPVAVVAAGGSSFSGGTEDHLPSTPHTLAHQWNLAAWAQSVDNQGQSPGGFAAFQVAHVPEPGTWLMLAGGLAALALRATRRR
ncbi:PEP-CTERM sorting domain-containing protein [Ideonella sp. DXS22W]|uniref:PEP-CTERM sorting domain-containing protein n=1 Tax=Pseudaquabacterium inlustre TaxID=2984192 RepID=A0ABU9CIC0_9BURK